jgi:hypothetical protein
VRRGARLLLLAGALGIGWLLFRQAPRDVVLVYGLGDREVTSVEVEIARGGEVVRRAELRPGPGPAGNVRHPVKLPDGEYVVRVRIAPPGAPAEREERSVAVTESTTIVLPWPSR